MYQKIIIKSMHVYVTIPSYFLPYIFMDPSKIFEDSHLRHDIKLSGHSGRKTDTLQTWHSVKCPYYSVLISHNSCM